MPETFPACPYLPVIDRLWPAVALAGMDDPCDLFPTALRCAQSRWRCGLPAQSLLMLNRAFACDLPDDAAALSPYPWPYAALGWILRHSPDDCFLGNPRRHFQHLATRMTDSPIKDLRVARAWACWAIARRVLPACIPDTDQLVRENITEPSIDSIRAFPVWKTRPRELALWQETLIGQP